MALANLRTGSTLTRVAIICGILFSVFFALTLARWSFANSVSTRMSDQDLAELMLKLGPDDPQTHYAAAVILEKTFEPQDLDRSLSEYEQAAVLSPNNYIAWLELAKARGRNGDVDGARPAYERAVDLAPNYSDVQWAFGNFLLRTGNVDDAFGHIARAANSKPALMQGAVTIAMSTFDSDIQRVRTSLGSTGSVDLALAKYAITTKDYPAAFDAWLRIPDGDRRSMYRDDARDIAAAFAGAKQFRFAVRVAADSQPYENKPIAVGAITNGGFETLDLSAADTFDWQIGSNTGQQIGLNAERKTSGNYSLLMVFSSSLTAEFKKISQIVAVEPGIRYDLSGKFRAELKGGLAWEITDAVDGKTLARTPALAQTTDWSDIQLSFTTPKPSDGVIISLVRDGCSTSICPITGRVWFDDLKLTRIQ